MFIRNPDPGLNGWDGLDDDFGDLHLQPGSPAIDRGDNLSVPSGIITDLDGFIRHFDDLNTPNGGRGTPPIVDRGAYEYFEPCPYTCGDMDGDMLINLNDFASFAVFFAMKADSQASICMDLNGDFDIDLNDFAVFANLFDSSSSNYPPACP
jgi:hypothetical protein